MIDAYAEPTTGPLADQRGGGKQGVSRLDLRFDSRSFPPPAFSERRHRGLARRAHYLEVAVPNSTLIRGAFENGLVKCAALRGLASDVSCDAAEVILGKVPVDQLLHVWILVPPIHAAIRLFIPLAMDAFFDQVLDPHQTI